MTNETTLFCIVDGDSIAFPIDILSGKSIGHLKEAIHEKKPKVFSGIGPDEVILWSVNVPDEVILWSVNVPDEGNKVALDNIEPKTILKSSEAISKVFGAKPEPETIHVIVERPSQ
ncbi:hypothetical protein BGX26_006471, partial [Mortierella sp. AD094]